MYKNFFFLNKFVVEADSELKGYTLTDAFSQDKDKLILAFRSGEKKKFIEISVNPGNSFITLRNKYSRAKRNSVSFFESHLPISILSVDIDRKSTRLNSSHLGISYAVFCLKKKIHH